MSVPMTALPLPRTFYARPAIEVAPALLGCLLHYRDGTIERVGRIVEVEAYCGESDRACHAYVGKTKRNETMFGPAGHAYVYLCYGIHHLFNIVCATKGVPEAVLVRAVEPVKNIEAGTNGPGKFTAAMGITTKDNGEDLLGPKLWLTKGTLPAAESIKRGPRIGVAYAGTHAKWPHRFWIGGNSYASKP